MIEFKYSHLLHLNSITYGEGIKAVRLFPPTIHIKCLDDNFRYYRITITKIEYMTWEKFRLLNAKIDITY